MKRTTLVFSTVMLAAIVSPRTAPAYPQNYGPFSTANMPRRFHLEDCAGVSATSMGSTGSSHGVTFFSQAGTYGVHITLSAGRDRQNTQLTVADVDNNLLCFPREVAPYFFASGIEGRTADLNGDKRPDFVVFLWSGGCGLMASFAEVLFVLSSATGYASRMLTTYDPASRDFVDQRGDGRCQFIRSAFIYGEAGRDGKAHNYWVHSLYRVEGQEVVPADNLDSRFPCWIWYTDKPNHKSTTQLTDDQKRRLWAEACPGGGP